jgi:hypothetical protein
MAPFPEFLFAESSRPGLEHRPVHADPADLKRFQEVRRGTADEQFGGWDPGRAFRGRRRVGPVAWRNRALPMTRHIVRWIAWGQLAVGLLLLWSALGDAPIPAVLKFP